jgi:hypothetical protein
MNLVKIFGLVLILGIFCITGAVSCGGGTTTVYPTDYDSAKSALSNANTQIASLQKQIESLQRQIAALQKQVNDNTGNAGSLQTKYDALNTAYQELSTQNTANLKALADLQTLYQQLKSEHDLIAQQAAEVNAVNIEKALLAAVNAERTANGLSTLLPGTNIIPLAKNNSQNMAAAKQLVSANAAYQEEFIATGYGSVGSIVSAAMTIWKSDTHWYQTNVLAINAIYGTVSAYLSGGIYYITFIASNFP